MGKWPQTRTWYMYHALLQTAAVLITYVILGTTVFTNGVEHQGNYHLDMLQGRGMIR